MIKKKDYSNIPISSIKEKSFEIENKTKRNKARRGIKNKNMMNAIKKYFGLKIGLFLCLLWASTVTSCKTQYIPIETGTTVHVIDSTAIHWIDSVIIHETRYRDFAWMGDTLNLVGSRSRAWAVADTLKVAIVGEIEEDPVEEKTRYIYKDKLVYKDSIVYKEKPVPVEITKEVKVIPKFWRVMGIVGIILSCVLVCTGYFKLRGKGFLKFLKR